jgi:hypothetical protein
MKKLLLALLLATSPAMAGNVPAKQGGLQTNSPTAHAVPVGEGTAAPVFVGPGAANSILSGNGASSDPAFVAPSTWLDAVFGATQGSVLYRGAATWSALAPGTTGYVLHTQGSSANPTWAADATGGLSGTYDITSATYGCTPSTSTGSTSNSTCLQNAINAAYAAGGGVVWVPAGFWNLASQIDIKPNVTVQCASNGAVYNSSLIAYGSVSGAMFAVNWGSGSQTISTAAFLLDTNAAIKGCGFWYPSQSPSASSPTVYGSTLLVYGVTDNSSTNNDISGNFFANSYAAIDLRGSVGNIGVARQNVYNNNGSCIAYCVLINYVVDWVSIHDNKWNAGSLNNTALTTGLVAWAANNGIAYYIQHSDWILLANEQLWGYQDGVQMDFTTACCGSFVDNGPVTISHCQFDAVFNGVILSFGTAQAVSIQNSTFTAFNHVTSSAGNVFANVSGSTVSSLQFIGNNAYNTTSPTGIMVNGLGTITNSVISGNVAASSSSPSTCFSIAAGTYGQIVNNICSGWTTAVSASGVTNLVNANNQL